MERWTRARDGLCEVMRRYGEIAVNPLDDAEMVWVPEGSSLMGSELFGDEDPLHIIGISRGFWLYRTPVTNAQYARFLQATP